MEPGVILLLVACIVNSPADLRVLVCLASRVASGVHAAFSPCMHNPWKWQWNFGSNLTCCVSPPRDGFESRSKWLVEAVNPPELDNPQLKSSQGANCPGKSPFILNLIFSLLTDVVQFTIWTQKRQKRWNEVNWAHFWFLLPGLLLNPQFI